MHRPDLFLEIPAESKEDRIHFIFYLLHNTDTTKKLLVTKLLSLKVKSSSLQVLVTKFFRDELFQRKSFTKCIL